MDIQVIIPTFNERENLPVIVRQVLERQGASAINCCYPALISF